jgi:hypothetical protein
MNRNLEIGQGESWGRRSGNLGLLLSLYFRRNERAVANSAVVQEIASFRVGGHTLRTAFSTFWKASLGNGCFHSRSYSRSPMEERILCTAVVADKALADVAEARR